MSSGIVSVVPLGKMSKFGKISINLTSDELIGPALSSSAFPSSVDIVFSIGLIVISSILCVNDCGSKSSKAS